MQKFMLAGKRCQTMKVLVERHNGPGLKRDWGYRDAQAGGLLFTDSQKNVGATN